MMKEHHFLRIGVYNNRWPSNKRYKWHKCNTVSTEVPSYKDTTRHESTQL